MDGSAAKAELIALSTRHCQERFADIFSLECDELDAVGESVPSAQIDRYAKNVYGDHAFCSSSESTVLNREVASSDLTTNAKIRCTSA